MTSLLKGSREGKKPGSITFSNKERKVFLSGEAYFEIAHNAHAPFKIVTADSMEVEVLGTAFNIMAYEDEKEIKTTLAEGKVKVRQGTDKALLSPSQQAVFKKDRGIEVRAADVEKETAWKNGIIEFNDDDLPSIMRELSRWYDVDIKFEGTAPGDRYNGAISRRATLSEVMQILRVAGVQYTLNNKTIVIKGK